MTDEEITRLLFVRDDPDKADVALVFASVREDELIRRTLRGIQLYKDRFVPTLLFSGGQPLNNGSIEAEYMADIARERHVPAEDILVERRSSNTFENVEFSKHLMRERDPALRPRKVILVSCEWHMRRVLRTINRLSPLAWSLRCCPPLEGCTRDTWTRSDDCRERVLEELAIFQRFTKAGII